MSNGRFHLRATLVLTPVAVVAGALSVEAASLPLSPVEGAAWAGLGCLAGILLTPDLDQEGISHVENQLIRLTLGIAHLWLAFWGPYASLIPHRSFLSHWPVLSTSVRLLYVWAGLRLLDVWMDAFVVPPLELVIGDPRFWVFFGGLALSDLGHWALDLPGVSRTLERLFPRLANRHRS